MARSEPLRLRVIKGVQAVIEAVTVDSNSSGDAGPEFTLADRVFRGRLWYGDSDPVPMISILEMPIAPDQLPSPEESATLAGPYELVIQGFCDEDRKHPSDRAYYLAADVVAALAKEKRRVASLRSTSGRAGALFGVLTPSGKPAVTDVQIGRPVCRPADDMSSKAYFWLRITLALTENLEEPYA